MKKNYVFTISYMDYKNKVRKGYVGYDKHTGYEVGICHSLNDCIFIKAKNEMRAAEKFEKKYAEALDLWISESERLGEGDYSRTLEIQEVTLEPCKSLLTYDE